MLITKKMWIIFGMISLFFLIFLSIILILFFNSKREVIVHKVSGGEINMTYGDEKNILSINNVNPMKDEDGIKSNDSSMFFDFTISSLFKKANKIEYEIIITKDNKKSNIDDKDIRIYLEKQVDGSYVECFKPSSYVKLGKKDEFGADKGDMFLFKDVNYKNDNTSYRLKMWLKDGFVKEENKEYNYAVLVSVKGLAK